MIHPSPARVFYRNVPARWILALVAALTVAIFLADTIFVISPALSVLYILTLLLLANSKAKYWVSNWAVLCFALSITAFLLGLPLSFGPMALPNLAIGLVAIAVTARQLTHSERLRSQLAADEARYRGVFNSLAVAIWECDLRPVDAAIADLRARGVRDLALHLARHPEDVAALRGEVLIVDANETALTMMGVTDKRAFPRPLGDLVPESDRALIACIVAIAERPPLFQTQASIHTARGDARDVIVAFGLGAADPLDRVAVSLFDVTEQNRLARLVAENREQLAHAQQSAALGQMSATIAHEIEQPLTAIHTSLDAATRWLRRDPIDVAEVTASIQTGLQGTRRAMDVIRRIRALIIGTAGTDMASLEIDALVQEATLLLQTDIVTSGTQLAHRLRAQAVLQADRILLQQVLVNVLRNALQAMAEVPQPERRIEIETAAIDRTVRLTITDSGPGWPVEILAEAFAAFRTTKPGGMGIGLSVCRTIIEAHGGAIHLRNAALGGATVEITLPIDHDEGDTTALRQDLQTQIRHASARAH